MATISTLAKFTVPLPSDAGNSSQGLLMPKLSYRFRVLMENFGELGETAQLTKQVMDFQRPTPKFEPIVLDVYNSKIQLAGKNSWDAITMTVRDDVTSEVQHMVGRQLQKQFDYYEQASARAGSDYKFKLKCQVLDGGNGAHEVTVLEQWTLVGCYIASATYSKLDYKSNEPASIALSILFDNATQSKTEEEDALWGVGEAVRRDRTDYASGIQGSV